MYAARQLERLFDNVAALNDSASNEGCDASLTVVDADAVADVIQEVARLRRLSQRLLVGQHDHRHGTSLYAYLVAAGVEFGENNFAEVLAEDFEPNRDESLSITDVGEPAVVGGIVEVLETILEFIAQHEEWWQDQLLTAIDKGGEGTDQQLLDWLRMARTAITPDDATQAFVGFVAAVQAGLIDWLNQDDTTIENALFDEAARAIGKDDEAIKAMKMTALVRLPAEQREDGLRDVQSSVGLVINVPQFFADPAFRAWLENDNQPKFTWHQGVFGEWSDVLVLVDPSLNGDGTDSDMPEHIWNQIVEACRRHVGPGRSQTHYTVRLTNLTT